MLNYFTFQKQIIRFRIEIGNNTFMDCIYILVYPFQKSYY